MKFNRNIMFVASFFVAASIAACTSTKNQKAGETNEEGNWAANMQAMAGNFSKLLPFVVSRSEFHDPKNRDDIAKLIEGFDRSIQKVPRHTGEKMLGDDPMIRYSLSRLQDDSGQALRAFKEGHVEYARNVLAQSISACFNCHSSQQFGPENTFSTAQLDSRFRMFPTERAQYYVATRQYDRAIEVLENVLRNPAPFYDEPHEQSLALKKYLSLMVRVRKDPVRAADTLEKFLHNKKLPFFIATDAEAWLKSLREWTREKNGLSPFRKARQLMAKADKVQSVASFQAGFVENLRATALLHDALKTATDAASKAQIYFMLGNAYDILADLGVWDLPEVYFEECIRTSPGTKISKDCYKSYERAVVLGFSGSAGTYIPAEERKKMAELKKLAGI